jgi:hypothetical protein
MNLPEGFEYEDFVELVNGLVFFWPGDESNPIMHGQRHFDRYRNERPVILRVPTRDIIADGNPALYSNCNSGAPRCSRGKYAPRGPSTFVAANQFLGAPGRVIEVVFSGSVALPMTTVVKSVDATRWQRL